MNKGIFQNETFLHFCHQEEVESCVSSLKDSRLPKQKGWTESPIDFSAFFLQSDVLTLLCLHLNKDLYRTEVSNYKKPKPMYMSY